MSTIFHIKKVYNLGEQLALSGEVEKGVIVEGDIGTTFSNKRFTIVKIQTKDGSIRRAETKQKVTLITKGILKTEVKENDTIFID